MRYLLASLLAVYNVSGSTWFASPSGNGDGSEGSPWHLQSALKTNSIAPGDTLLLQSGTYAGPFRSTISGTAEGYITVKPVSGGVATITDGHQGALESTIGEGSAYSTITGISISGDTFWVAGQILLIGSEQFSINSKSGDTWSLTRGWGGTSTAAHSIGDPVRMQGNIIDHTGSYVRFMDLRITSIFTTNRTTGDANGVGVYAGLNCDVGVGNKAVNLVIYNTGHPAIGFWDQGDGGEINGCVFWGTGVYDNNGSFIRGTGIYSQNTTGSVYFKNNISIRNFTEGMQAYGTTAEVNGFNFINNITAANPNGYGIAIWNAEVSMTNNAAWTNYHGIDGQIWGYTSTSNREMSMVGNVLVRPPNPIFIKQFQSGVVSNNTIMFDGHGGNSGLLQFDNQTTVSTDLGFVFDHNAYYYTNHATDLFGFVTSDHPSGSGKYTFANWKSTSGFDANSTIQSTLPTDYLKVAVQPLDYDSNRWHIAVISTSGQTNTTLNLASACGFTSGQRYQLRDAQNYFTAISSGTYSSGTIDLPLNLTNVSTINGTLTHYTNEHTNVDYPGLFNAFVLTRETGATLTLGTLNAVNLQ